MGIGIPNPGDIVGSVVKGLSGLLGGGAGPIKGILGQLIAAAVGGFEAIIKVLFAPIAKFITVQVIHWVITIPNLTGGQVYQLEQTVAGLAVGAAFAVATFAIVRYWLTGLLGTGSSGMAGLEGLAQTVLAILLIAVWPKVFGGLVGLTNAFTMSLLDSHAVLGQTAQLIGTGLSVSSGSGPLSVFGLFIMIVLAVIASLLFLGLLFMKIMVSASTLLIFVGMPLALILWPVSPWVGRIASRALAVCLAVPVVWAVAFTTAGAVSANVLTHGAGSALNTLLQPLVAIALLLIMIRLPVHLARMAMLGAAPLGGGFISRAASYAAGSQIRETIRTHLPATAGGRGPAADSARHAEESRAGQRLQRAARLAAAAATGGTSAAASAAAGAASGTGASRSASGASAAATSTAGKGKGKDALAYTPPPAVHAVPFDDADGLQNVAFRMSDWRREMRHAAQREDINPVTAAQASQALGALPAATRRGVAALAAEHGAGAREHLANQALGRWTPTQRDALRALAAATPEIREQAIGALAGSSAAIASAATGGASATASILAADARADSALATNGHGHSAHAADGPGSSIEPAGASGGTIEPAALIDAGGGVHDDPAPPAAFDTPAGDQPAGSGWGEVIDVDPTDVIRAGDTARPSDDAIHAAHGDVTDLAASEWTDDPPSAGPDTEQTPPPVRDQPPDREPPREPRAPRASREQRIEPRDLFRE